MNGTGSKFTVQPKSSFKFSKQTEICSHDTYVHIMHTFTRNICSQLHVDINMCSHNTYPCVIHVNARHTCSHVMFVHIIHVHMCYRVYVYIIHTCELVLYVCTFTCKVYPNNTHSHVIYVHIIHTFTCTVYVYTICAC